MHCRPTITCFTMSKYTFMPCPLGTQDFLETTQYEQTCKTQVFASCSELMHHLSTVYETGNNKVWLNWSSGYMCNQ